MAQGYQILSEATGISIFCAGKNKKVKLNTKKLACFISFSGFANFKGVCFTMMIKYFVGLFFFTISANLTNHGIILQQVEETIFEGLEI